MTITASRQRGWLRAFAVELCARQPGRRATSATTSHEDTPDLISIINLRWAEASSTSLGEIIVHCTTAAGEVCTCSQRACANELVISTMCTHVGTATAIIFEHDFISCVLCKCTTGLDRRARAGVLRNSVVLGCAVLLTTRAFRICRVCGYNAGRRGRQVSDYEVQNLAGARAASSGGLLRPDVGVLFTACAVVSNAASRRCCSPGGMVETLPTLPGSRDLVPP